MENLDLVNDWMGVSEASHELHVSAQRVRQFADSGRIRFVQTAIGRLVHRGDVEQLRQERAGQSRSPRGRNAA